jgi:hypothetical protein
LSDSPQPPKPAWALERFREIEKQLPNLLKLLVEASPHHRDRKPAVPHVPAVYLFTEEEIPRYLGRTRDANRRLGEHTRPSSPQNSAPFAFNIARREAAEAGLTLMGTRKEIAATPAFQPYFTRAKERIRQMEFRFVEINDSVVSTIFEVYAALALRTEGEFNLFDTH